MNKDVNYLLKRSKEASAKIIIDSLNKAYADEWLAFYQYFIEAKLIEGELSKAAIKELEQHAKDEYRHAGLVIDRIIELGGKPITTPAGLIKGSGCGFVEPKKTDTASLLQDSIKGEKCAVKAYEELQLLTKGSDQKTYDIVSLILDEEKEHQSDLESILNDLKKK